MQLSASELSKIPGIRECVALLGDVGVYIAESPKRQGRMRAWQQIADVDLRKLRKLSQVRLLSNMLIRYCFRFWGKEFDNDEEITLSAGWHVCSSFLLVYDQK